MVIDVHCHIGFSAKRADPNIQRFSFEQNGAAGHAGFDSYFSPRLIARPAWFFVRRWLGVDPRLKPGDALDAAIESIYEKHWSQMPSVDRLVLLAFDEYHDDDGCVIGPAGRFQKRGSDIYSSNSFVAAYCRTNPNRYLFGASLHPYRVYEGRSAPDLLVELAASSPRPSLIKWLPIHQNIRADDPRTIAFLRRAAELKITILVHYGGEMSLSRQHMEFEHPGPMLGVLRKLRTESAMPTVIVAHLATPSFPWQSADGFNMLAEALTGEFREAPLYADISALAAFGRTSWLPHLAERADLQRKVVWGTDFPIPVMFMPYWRHLDRTTRRRIAAIPSWVEQDFQLKKAFNLQPEVFTRAAEILRVS
ncbi:MAG: hypothetical protein IPK83_12455 [Planctomycetes bacterium]|nr:hypothetical protein [Planctomycetota bacterium]